MSEFFYSDFVLKSLKASLLNKKDNIFQSVTIDSRTAVKDQLFFALKGKNFDGHNFLDQAFSKGVKGFVISDKQKAKVLLKKKDLSFFYVPDPLKALQDLAQSWTQKMETKVLAITGSNGKTSTKNFTKTLLSSLNPFVSPKSYNNGVGVPLSLLKVQSKHAFLIQEIGTSYPGEVAHLVSLCRPTVSLVTMVGPSHLEGLLTLEGVAKEKKQIYLQSPKATWIFNRDNPFTEAMFQEFFSSHANILSFSKNKKEADIRLSWSKESAEVSVVKGFIGSVSSQASVSLSGWQNLDNLMSACAIALSVSIAPEEIWSLLPHCCLPLGRQNWLKIKEKNISIFFDAYNSNPSSMAFFLDSFEKFSRPQQRLFVLGDMKELGKDSEKYHRQIAEHPAILNSRFVVFIGEYGPVFQKALEKKGFKGRVVCSTTYGKPIFSQLKEVLKEDDYLGVKASRSLKLENLFYDLTGRRFFP